MPASSSEFCRSSRTSARSGAQNNKDNSWGVTESVMRVRGGFFLNRKMKDRVEAVGFVFLYEPLSRLWRVQETRTKGKGNEKKETKYRLAEAKGRGGQRAQGSAPLVGWRGWSRNFSKANFKVK